MLTKQYLSNLNPSKFTKLNNFVSGEFKLADFARVASFASNGDEVVNLSLKFYQDESSNFFVAGKFSAQINCNCQRCLQNFLLPVSNDFRYQIELTNKPENKDSLFVTDNSINLWEVIEDEFLLSLPIVPKHIEDCSIQKKSNNQENLKKPNPFAILNQLKENN